MPRPLRALTSILVLALALSPAAPADAADPTSELAAKYSPIVVVRDQPEQCGDGEPYLPTAVESVLGKDDVVLVGPGGERISAPTATDLAGKGEGWYLDLPGNPLAPGCDYQKWFDAFGSPSPTVYAHVVTDPDHPGQLALQYWFFWVFNDWNDKHEGDWEMIQILFAASTPEQALALPAPTSVAFAQHEGSEVSGWDDPKLAKVGDHPVVYPSQGSHAAYFTQSDWFGRSAAAGFGCDNTTALGRELIPDVIVIPSEPTEQPPWLSFTGRWGEKAPSFNNGPTGPNAKGQWTHPVTWQEEEGRPDAVAIPVFGGPAETSFCFLTAAGSQLFITALNSPVLTALVVLGVLLALILLVRATRWRDTQWRTPDRERRAGQIVGASFGLIFGRLGSFWPIIAIGGLAAAAPLAMSRLALLWLPDGDITDVRGLAWSDGIDGLYIASISVIIGVSVLGNIVIALAMAAAARTTDDLATGSPSSGWQSIVRSVRHPSAAAVQLVLFYAVALLASSLLLLPIALVLIALFAVAMPAAAVENLGFVTAFRRSLALTRGRRWRSVLLSALLLWIGFLVPGVIGALVLLLTGWAFWVTNLIAIVIGAFLAPFAAVGLTLQYYDFRQEERRDSDA